MEILSLADAHALLQKSGARSYPTASGVALRRREIGKNLGTKLPVTSRKPVTGGKASQHVSKEFFTHVLGERAKRLGPSGVRQMYRKYRRMGKMEGFSIANKSFGLTKAIEEAQMNKAMHKGKVETGGKVKHPKAGAGTPGKSAPTAVAKEGKHVALERLKTLAPKRLDRMMRKMSKAAYSLVKNYLSKNAPDLYKRLKCSTAADMTDKMRKPVRPGQHVKGTLEKSLMSIAEAHAVLKKSTSSGFKGTASGKGGAPFKHKGAGNSTAPKQRHYLGDKPGEHATDVHPNPRHNNFRKYGVGKAKVEASKGMAKRELVTKKTSEAKPSYSTDKHINDIWNGMVNGEIMRVKEHGKGPKLGSTEVGYFIMGEKKGGTAKGWYAPTPNEAIEKRHSGQGEQNRVLRVDAIGKTVTAIEKIGRVNDKVAQKWEKFDAAERKHWIKGVLETEGAAKSMSTPTVKLGQTLDELMAEKSPIDETLGKAIKKGTIRGTDLPEALLKAAPSVDKASGKAKLTDAEAIKYLNVWIRGQARCLVRDSQYVKGGSSITAMAADPMTTAAAQPAQGSYDLDKMAECIHDRAVEDATYNVCLLHGTRALGDDFSVRYVRRAIKAMKLDDTKSMDIAQDAGLLRREVLG